MLEKSNRENRVTRLGRPEGDDAVVGMEGAGKEPGPAGRSSRALRGGGGRDGRAAEGPTQSAGDLIFVLWRRKWIVLICMAAALGSAFLYLRQATRIYRCSAQVYVPQSGPQLVSNVVSAAQNNASYLPTQCELIRSTLMIRAALAAPEMQQVQWLRAMGDPVAELRNAIDAQVAKQGDIINVSIESPFPRDAAVLLNGVLHAYITQQKNEQRSTSAEFLSVLQKEKEKRDIELQDTYKSMLAYRTQHALLTASASDLGNTSTQRLATLSAALTQAELDAMDLRLKLDTIQALSNDPVRLRQITRSLLAREVAATGAPDPEAELHQLEAKLSELSLDYGSQHPARRRVELRLSQIRAEHAAAANASAANAAAQAAHVSRGGTDNSAAEDDDEDRQVLRARLALATNREKQLAGLVEAQRKIALEVNGRAAEYNQLESNARRLERVLDLLDTRIKELSVSEGTVGPSIAILEGARPEMVPVRPNRARALGLSAVAGLLLGLAAAMLQDWMDQRLRSSSEIESLLRLPVLGVVPHMMGNRTPAQKGREIVLIPRSDVSESYRSVRTTLRFGATGSEARTLLVTSPMQGDGKTTTASNLAMAVAQTGRTVLLIDADCRKPMQHLIHGINGNVGLTSVLRGEHTLASAVQPGNAAGLDVLACGPIPLHPDEVLDSPALEALLAEAAGHYDQVIIDSPPVIPVADARILAARCDATLLVLRADRATRRLTEHARDSLVSVCGNLLGVVVNDVPRSQRGAPFFKGGGVYEYVSSNKEPGKNGNGNGKTHTPALVGAREGSEP